MLNLLSSNSVRQKQNDFDIFANECISLVILLTSADFPPIPLVRSRIWVVTFPSLMVLVAILTPPPSPPPRLGVSVERELYRLVVVFFEVS